MAARYKLLGIVHVLSSFLLPVGGQCSIDDVLLAHNGFVLDQSAGTGHLSVPVSEAPSTWTCLYHITEGACNSTFNAVSWRGESRSPRYCVDLTYKGSGRTTCMLAVDLHVQQPAPGSIYQCDSIGGVSVQLMFGNGVSSPGLNTCFQELQRGNGCSGSPPSSSTPSSGTTTPSFTTPQPSFSGINPLIYTVTAVALLGTASIVAMISCCIRQRRAMLRRREFLFGREYLDFMSDRDFTQLTANQLAASLHEAPPTYQQSEDIERQLKDTQEDDTPPPLPPRNQPQEPSNTPVPVEPIPSDHSEDEEEQENILQLLL